MCQYSFSCVIRENPHWEVVLASNSDTVGFCAFISQIGQLKSGQETGGRERE